MPAVADMTEMKRLPAIAIARNIAAALVAFVISAAALQLVFPPLEVSQISQVSKKLAYLHAHQDEFDTLFVGSSRFYHQIIAKQFDAEMAAAGHPTHSFNLGVDSMLPPESFYYLRQVLAAHPHKLKWVFFELMPLVNTTAFNKGETTKRLVYWHDFPTSWLSMRFVAEYRNHSLFEKARDDWRHVTLLLRNESRTGRALDSLTAIFSKKPAYPPPWLGHHGTLLIDRTATAADSQQLIEGERQFKTNPPPRLAPYPALIDGLRRAVREIRAAGATPVFITAQTLKRNEYLDSIHKYGLNVKVFAFNDPVRYPVLYEPEMHYDFIHLNKKGAPIFTGYLAKQFAQWIESSEKSKRNAP